MVAECCAPVANGARDERFLKLRLKKPTFLYKTPLLVGVLCQRTSSRTWKSFYAQLGKGQKWMLD